MQVFRLQKTPVFPHMIPKMYFELELDSPYLRALGKADAWPCQLPYLLLSILQTCYQYAAPGNIASVIGLRCNYQKSTFVTMGICLETWSWLSLSYCLKFAWRRFTPLDLLTSLHDAGESLQYPTTRKSTGRILCRIYSVLFICLHQVQARLSKAMCPSLALMFRQAWLVEKIISVYLSKTLSASWDNSLDLH